MSLRWTRRMVALCMVLGALLGRGAADDLRKAARQAFHDGKRAFEAGDYPTAYDHFKKAYDLAPVPDLLYNLGRCLEEMDQLEEALATYERFIAAHPDELTEVRMTNLRGRIALRPHKPPPPPTTTTEPPPPPAPAPPTVAASVVAAPAPAKRPLYRRWWLWTGVGVLVAAGVGVGIGVGLSRAASGPTFPVLNAR